MMTCTCPKEWLAQVADYEDIAGELPLEYRHSPTCPERTLDEPPLAEFVISWHVHLHTYADADKWRTRVTQALDTLGALSDEDGDCMGHIMIEEAIAGYVVVDESNDKLASHILFSNPDIALQEAEALCSDDEDKVCLVYTLVPTEFGPEGDYYDGLM